MLSIFSCKLPPRPSLRFACARVTVAWAGLCNGIATRLPTSTGSTTSKGSSSPAITCEETTARANFKWTGVPSLRTSLDVAGGVATGASCDGAGADEPDRGGFGASCCRRGATFAGSARTAPTFPLMAAAKTNMAISGRTTWSLRKGASVGDRHYLGNCILRLPQPGSVVLEPHRVNREGLVPTGSGPRKQVGAQKTRLPARSGAPLSVSGGHRKDLGRGFITEGTETRRTQRGVEGGRSELT